MFAFKALYEAARLHLEFVAQINAANVGVGVWPPFRLDRKILSDIMPRAHRRSTPWFRLDRKILSDIIRRFLFRANFWFRLDRKILSDIMKKKSKPHF